MSENQDIETAGTEDVEGHMPRHKVDGEDETTDTEGHMPHRKIDGEGDQIDGADDDLDTEGHAKKK